MSQPESRDDLASLTRNGAWLLGTRMITMGIGLLSLPILMSALGLLNFGAWAVLLGGTFAFGTLELGMSSAVMRWATLAMMPESSSSGGHDLGAIMSNSLLCTATVFAVVGFAVYFTADPLAGWLNLPATPLLSPGECILLIYATVAVMALLRCTIAPLPAARMMKAYGAFTVLQAIVSAGATWTMAWATRRLDLVLIANAVAIIAVQSLAAAWTWNRMHWRLSPALLDRRLAGSMLRYGAALQFSDVSMFVIYQFDKLIISGVVAPVEVAHYEVASRSAQALGSFSSSPLGAFAPTLTEQHGRSEDLSHDLLRLLRLTVLGAGFFLLLPMAVAPIALFAWVGQIGYHAAGTFTLLALAMISTLLVTPLSMAAQAMGQASMELKRASGAMLINLPAAAILISLYGKEGAALGTLLACFTANTVFARWLLRRLGLPQTRVMLALRPLIVPMLAGAVLLAMAARLIEPFVISSRWYMAPAAVGLYAVGLLAVFMWLWQSGALLAEERAFFVSLKDRLLSTRIRTA